MKRFFTILGIFLLLIIVSIFLIPILFKGKIVERIKVEANKTINARLDFNNDIDISIIRNFPDLTLTIDDLVIVNNEPFDGDTLVAMDVFEGTVDIMSVIKGDGPIDLKSIDIQSPVIFLTINKDGIPNWDIALATEGETTADTAAAGFEVSLSHYNINNGVLFYNDQQADMSFLASGIDHSGEGDFTETIFNLKTLTLVDSFTYVMEGIEYLSNVETELDAILEINLDEFKYTFKENLLRLNDFKASFDGYIAMPTEDIMMDLSFASTETDFKTLLSLVPAIFMKDFENLEAKGSVNFAGNVIGVFGENSMPAYNVSLQVNDGMFKYPDLPSSMHNVNVNAAVHNPDGIPDNTVINVKALHFEMGKDPFDARLYVKTPISDPFLDADMKGKIDLGGVKNVVPLEKGTTLAGLLDADVSVRGNLSAIEQERYDEFIATGTILVSKFFYSSADLPETVEIPSTELHFNPSAVDLRSFSMKMGESDLHANGKLRNLIGYMIKDSATLHGDFNATSSYFNLNPFMAEEDGNTGTSTGEPEAGEPLEAIKIPPYLDFTLEGNFRKLIYDNMELTNLLGTIIVRDEKVILEDVRMTTLGGDLALSGTYDSKVISQPKADFELDISNFSIINTFNTFVSVQKLAPIAKYLQGNFNAKMNLSTILDQNMMPVWESFFSQGKLIIDQVIVEGTPVTHRIADAIKKEEFKSFQLKGIRPSYKVEKGRFYLLEPIDFMVDKAEVSVTGSSSIDQVLNYVMRVKLPAGQLKQEVNSWVSGLAGKNLDLPVGEKILVDLNIGGTFTDPIIKPSFAGIEGTGKNVQDALKKKAEEELRKAREEAERRAREEIQKKQKEVEDQARQEAEKRRKELEEKARQEKEKKEQELKKEAEDKLKDLFKNK